MGHKNYFWKTIALLLFLFITIGSLVKPASLPIKDLNVSDKVTHSVAYFVLSISCFFAIPSKCKKIKIYYLVSILIIFYGILIEVLQKVLTTTRQADYLDSVANAMGVALAFVLFLIFCKKKVIN